MMSLKERKKLSSHVQCDVVIFSKYYLYMLEHNYVLNSLIFVSLVRSDMVIILIFAKTTILYYYRQSHKMSNFSTS